MKKLLLSLTAMIMCFGFAMAKEVTFDFVNNTYYLGERNSDYYFSSGTATIDEISLSLAKTSGNGWRLWNDGLRAYTGTVSMNITGENVVISKIVINKLSSKLTSIQMNEETAITKDATSFTFEPNSAEALFTIVMSGSKAFTTVTVTYEIASDKDAAGLSFPESAYDAIIGETFTAPELTKATTAAVTYSSNNVEVASVDATTGAITIGTKPGTATITATAEENDTYAAGSAKYTITVMGKYNSVAEYFANVEKSCKSYINFETVVVYANGANIYVKENKENGAAALIYKYDSNFNEGDVLSAGWIAECDIYNGLPELKPVTMPTVTETGAYSMHKEVNSVTADMVNEVIIIRNVEFEEATPERTADNKATSFNGTIDGTSYTFRTNFIIESVAAGKYDVLAAVALYNGNIQLYPIRYEEVLEESQVPVISAEGANEDNEFCEPITVTITAAEGATIYYNLSGNVAWYTYSEPITITETTTIMAYAHEEGKMDSENVYATFTYNPELSINGIEVENGEAEYYNMQGVRVTNPENGMYIRVINGKASKVVVK